MFDLILLTLGGGRHNVPTENQKLLFLQNQLTNCPQTKLKIEVSTMDHGGTLKGPFSSKAPSNQPHLVHFRVLFVPLKVQGDFLIHDIEA